MKNVVKLAALMLASLAMALLLAEGMLGLVGFQQPQLYEPHPLLGWMLRPNAQVLYNEEGRALVEVNSAGMRDREHAALKPAGVYRVAILGDSYSEAKQVPIDSTYWRLLPRELGRCGFQPGRRVEVLNFSASGYGTAQELLLLRLAAARYRPDLVVLQFTSGNDVRNNSRALEPAKARPFFVLEGDGKLRLDDSFASKPKFRRIQSLPWRAYRSLAAHSRVLQLARVGIRAMRRAPPEDDASGAEAGLDGPVLSASSDPRWEEAWRVTEALIADMSREAASQGAEMLVIGVPWAAQVLPDVDDRSNLATRLGVPDLGHADRRLEALGRAHGIPVLTLSGGMGEAALASGRHMNGFEPHLGIGHWNPVGHRAAAGLIAQRLCEDPRSAAGRADVVRRGS